MHGSTSFSGFQSAPPHGGRRYTLVINSFRSDVSIRAPARGATRSAPRLRASIQRFNPRPRTGGDRTIRAITTISNGFQSAPPHGGRRTCWTIGPTADCFNPRPRTGGDIGLMHTTARCWCFNPRPRTGGDAVDRKLPHVVGVSIRAPARGATLSVADVALAIQQFQSAPPHGGRPWISPISVGLRRFNPRPRTGGDRFPFPSLRAASCFNPRPRTGGDRGLSKRPEELRLAWSLRELCMVVDVTHPCNTFVSSQHLC